MTISNFTSSGIHWIEATDRPGAPCVVLLHGLGGDAQFWTAEQQCLRSRFRVLAVDLRGCGLTASCPSGFCIDDLAQDIIEVLDAAEAASAHVVGFSLGGLVAQALAGNFAGRVASLELGATFAMTPPHAKRFLRAVGDVYGEGASTKQVFELVLPWLFSTRFLASPQGAPFLEYPTHQPDRSRDDWLRMLDAQLSYDGRSRLSTIRTPTLVVSGDEDRLVPSDDAVALALGIRDADLKWLPGGHLFNVEHLPEFIGALEGFFQDVTVGVCRGGSRDAALSTYRRL